jgi:histone acetyltransferase 1
MRAQFEGALQPLFFWYIDGASAIDAADGERWEVYAAYEVLRRGEGGEGREGGGGGDDEAAKDATARPRALVGFATVFTFQTPFQGERARVCQVLVLPPYQGRGHGVGLLRALNGSLRARGDALTLITVEDPAPAFRRLRTRVDLADVAAGGFFGRPAADDDNDAAACRYPVTAFAAARPSDAAVGAVRAALKITERQVWLCYEGLRLRHGVDRSDEAAYKAYRLDVKRRLLADCADEIEEAMGAACADEELDRASPEGAALAKAARKEWLDRRYKEVEAAYDAALRHLA